MGQASSSSKKIFSAIHGINTQFKSHFYGLHIQPSTVAKQAYLATYTVQAHRHRIRTHSSLFAHIRLAFRRFFPQWKIQSQLCITCCGIELAACKSEDPAGSEKSLTRLPFRLLYINSSQQNCELINDEEIERPLLFQCSSKRM